MKQIETSQDGMWQLPTITRVEVIDENGRSYTKGPAAKDVSYSIQDEGRTLKVFIGRK